MTTRNAAVEHDTRIHVAQFLHEGIGATRQTTVALDRLALDSELMARAVEAPVRLTRIPTGILAKGQVAATVELTCIRCLEEFAQRLSANFADEYRPTIDIMTGQALPETEQDDQEVFPISEFHVLDVAESLRQALVLALPMAPLCREDCPGLLEFDTTLNDTETPLAVLGTLLTNDETATTDDPPRDEEADQPARRRKRHH